MSKPAFDLETPPIIHLAERYTLSNEEAQKIAHQTLDTIQSLNLNANPIHFALLYESLSNIDPHFAQEVQQTLQTQTYDDTKALKLFSELWARIIQTILPTNAFETQLNTLLTHIDQWMNQTKQHHQDIKNSLEEIQTVQFTEHHNVHLVFAQLEATIQPKIDALVSETHQLHSHIHTSKQQIEALKKELQNAHKIAHTDELTQLPNRRGYQAILSNTLQQANQTNRSFALLLLDIDHFKKINDTYGHLIGDAVLQHISKLLYRETKGQDFIARIGGEEFAILLPNTPYKTALHVAEKIRTRIAQPPLKHPEIPNPLYITVSIGVAMYQLSEDTDSLFARADQALYLAKKQGRNQVKGETEC